jgi:hypothetical protein
MSGILAYRTQGFNGYAVKYSPFFDSRIAVSASANFGLMGNGRLYILSLTANGIQAEKWYALWATTVRIGLLIDLEILGLILKTRSLILLGRKRTRTRSLLAAETVQLSSLISPSTTSRFSRGRNIIARCFQCSGIWFQRILLHLVPGTGQLRLYICRHVFVSKFSRLTVNLS